MTELRKAAQQVTPRADLLAELMDSNEPKTEREHAAVYEIERLRAALAQPDVPNWIHAIDEELVGTFIGVANVSDTYEVAKKKLGELIDWHVQVAIDPAVNGGCVLVPARVPLTEDDLHRLVNEFFYEGMTPTGKHLKNFANAVIAAYEAENNIKE